MGDIRVEGGIRLAGRDYYEGCVLNLPCVPCARCEQRLVCALGDRCRACQSRERAAQVRRAFFIRMGCWMAVLPFASNLAELVTRNGPDAAVLALLLTVVGGSLLDAALFRLMWALRPERGA